MYISNTYLSLDHIEEYSSMTLSNALMLFNVLNTEHDAETLFDENTSTKSKNLA